MINIKNLDPHKIKLDKKSYKNILVYHIGYVTVNNLSYAKINSKNLNLINLHLIVDKINRYIEKSNNGNKYLTLVFTDKSNDITEKNLKNYGIKSEMLLDK